MVDKIVKAESTKTKSVLEQLDVVMTREEWDTRCKEQGSRLPYPYADVIQFSG